MLDLLTYNQDQYRHPHHLRSLDSFDRLPLRQFDQYWSVKSSH
jgi:hypothetical protein